MSTYQSLPHNLITNCHGKKTENKEDIIQIGKVFDMTQPHIIVGDFNFE